MILWYNKKKSEFDTGVWSHEKNDFLDNSIGCYYAGITVAFGCIYKRRWRNGGLLYPVFFRFCGTIFKIMY